jgi:GTP pyrophosphokinase
MYEEGIVEENGKHTTSSDLKSAQAASEAVYFGHQKEWIDGLHKIEQEIKNNNELLENLKNDTFQDRIFVLTPRGDVKDLPIASTPIDFAYEVHTDVGNNCFAAKVNGNIVPLDYALRSGEVVEIITRKNARPSQHWLSFAKTNHARNRIRGFFRSLHDDKHLRDGKELLNEKLIQFGLETLDDKLTILKKYGERDLDFNERKEILLEIGRGVLMAGTVVRNLFTVDELMFGYAQTRTPKAISKPRVRTGKKDSETKTPVVTIGGQTDLPYQFMRCCTSNFADDLIGYVTRGHGVSLHKKNCPSLLNNFEGRLISVSVDREHGRLAKYPVCVAIEAGDRLGLIRDICSVIANHSINIVDVFQDTVENNTSKMSYILEVDNFDQLERVLASLEKVHSVRRAFKVN